MMWSRTMAMAAVDGQLGRIRRCGSIIQIIKQQTVCYYDYISTITQVYSIFSYDGASKNKNEIVYCFYCNGHLKHIHMPPHQHPATSSTMYTTTATSRGSVFPRDGSPTIQMVHKSSKKSNNFSRRRISSPIYASARHYCHQLTCKNLPERCLAGYDAQDLNQRHTKAIDGHRLTGEAGCL